MKIKQWLIGCVVAVLVSIAHAEKGQAFVNVAGDARIEKGATDESWLYATPEQTQWLKDAGFGLFVHWGPISQLGHDLSWSRKGGRRWGSIKYPETGIVPMKEYDALYKTFNPTNFNPQAWVQMMQDVGMEYIVFTTKHHDGFCMFDSAYTDYDIMSTPYGRDIFKELTDACHKAGIRVGVYYSATDWHHPDFRTEHMDRYLDYYFNQMRELVTKYEPDVIWWDAIGCNAEEIKSKEMTKMLRELRPGILLNNRAGLRGDFDTPEQLVGRFQKDRPWETCMTINDQWGYRPNNPPKPETELVQTLVRCAGGNGNFLLNLGPMQDGRFDPMHEDRLREVGDWNKKYGVSVFDTRGGPYMPGVYGATTYRDDTIYIHMMDWGEGDKVAFPPLPFKILSHKVLTGGEAKVEQTAAGVFVSMKENRDAIDTIIELKIDGDAGTVEPIKVPYHSGSLALNKPATASTTIFNDIKNKGPWRALDDDVDTMWVADLMAVSNIWFEVDLEKPTLINRIAMRDAHKRTRRFALQYEKDGEWVTFYKKTGLIGHHFDEVFEPFTAQKVRLYIHEAIAGPQLAEFHILYSPEKQKDPLTHRYTFNGSTDDLVGTSTAIPSTDQTFTESPAYSDDVPAYPLAGAPSKSIRFGESYGTKKSGLFLPGGTDTVLSLYGSLSVWVKANAMNGGNYLLYAPTPGMLMVFSGGRQLTFTIGKGEIKKTINSPFTAGEWHLVTATWDVLKGTAAFYVDGKLKGSIEGLSSEIVMAGDIRVGQYDDPRVDRASNSINQFDGMLYDLQFYGRVLTPQEVGALFAAPGAAAGKRQEGNAKTKTQMTQAILPDSKRQNILFILVDDQSPFDLKEYNSESPLHSPVLNRLAENGMVVEQAYHLGGFTPAVCSPSRHMIMTGRTVWRLPHSVGPTGLIGDCPATIADETMGEIFKRAGYATMRTCKTGNTYPAANERFEVVHDVTMRGADDESGSGWHVKQVLNYLNDREAQKDERPFLIFYGFSHPHDMRNAKPELAKKYGAVNHYDSATLPVINPALAPKLPANYLPAHPFDNGDMNVRDEVDVNGVWRNRDEATIRNENGRELALVENIDIQIGKVLDKLKAMGELENTYIIYTSDHGISIGRHGLVGKQNLYEHAWRVPYIVKGPGIKPGTRAKGNIYLHDTLPTLLELAGIEVPKTVDGTSFKPVLMGREDAVRDVLYGVYCGGSKPGIRAVRKGDWKLIKYDVLDGQVRKTQLFNLKDNPDELLTEHRDPSVVALTGNVPKPNQRNLADDPKYADKLKEMEDLLLSEMKRYGDPYRLWNQK